MMKMIASKNPTRRQFLASTGAVAGSLLMRAQASGVNSPLLQGEAEHVVSIWLGGGMGQIDTFDPKAKGDPKAKVPGSYYDSIDTAVDGVKVCEHLPMLAERMERITAIRTTHHDVIDEHAAATNRMHTGRQISGTVTYPCLLYTSPSPRDATLSRMPSSA